MKKEVADKWIEALESGKYEQGKNTLYGKRGFCCLGVLCDISGLGEWKREKGQINNRYVISDTEKVQAWLPETVQKWAGMKSIDGSFLYEVHINGGTYDHLTGMNDYGITFKLIAEIIRKRWEEL